MKRNNKGLSLVELIVAIAIFAIAGVAICGFIIFCTKQFSSSNKNVKVQYEQQIVINRIRDIILEASRGIKFDPEIPEGGYNSDSAPNCKSIMIYSDNSEFDYKEEESGSNARCIITELSFIEGEGDAPGVLKYNDQKVTSDTLLESFSFSNESVELCDNIKEFKVIRFENNEVELKIVFKVGDKELEVSPIIKLRNNITNLTDDTELSDLYKGGYEVEYSVVKKIEIARDGKVFRQSKIDTIAMAGDITTVDYDVIVTKKKNYTAPINNDATWRIDKNTVTEGYESFIVIDENAGTVTLRNDSVNNKTPNDYIVGEYFIIEATSIEDTNKKARLKIKVTHDGVYPETITTEDASKNSYEEDPLTGYIVYTLKHEITYTGEIEDPSDGQKKKVLSGDGVYSKITYTITGDETPPNGAGFSNEIVDGRFIANSSMKGKTYHVVVMVNQKDKDGNPVKDEFDINIPEEFPEKREDVTYPVMVVGNSILRNDYLTVMGSWSNGYPTYMGKVDKIDYVYYPEYKEIHYVAEEELQFQYEYEWEIIPGDCKEWKSNTKDSFDNIYFCDIGNKYNNKGHTYTSSSSSNRVSMFAQPYLNWDKSFTYTINLRVKLKDNKGNNYYFMMPGKDASDRDKNYTSDRNSAYVVSKIITVDKVELLLTPINKQLCREVNAPSKGYFNSVFHEYDYICDGLKPRKNEVSEWEKNKYSYPIYDEAKDYYKMFIPKFTGILVNIMNYNEILSGVVKNNSEKTSLQKYYLQNGRENYDNIDISTYENVIDRNLDNKLYVYLKMTPSKWKGVDQIPDGVRWMCVIEGKEVNGVKNKVTAKFSTTNAEYMNYKYIPNKYDYHERDKDDTSVYEDEYIR